MQAAQAASIEVISNLDDGTDCTLREAIATVNAGSDQFNGCAVTGDAIGTSDTINFGPAVAGQTIALTQGELQITKNVSINPDGVNTTIDGNNASGVMFVTSDDATDLTVTFNRLTVSGGGSGGISVVNNYYDYQASLASTVSMTLTNSTVSGNVGNGIHGRGSFSFSTPVNVTLTNSTVSNNSGYGISVVYDGNVTLTNSTISDNGSTGIYVAYSEVYLTNITVSGNYDNGIRTYVTGTTLSNSTVSDNSGGGIAIGRSSINLSNSTVSDNSGGGISIFDARVSINNSTVTGNTGGNGGIFVDGSRYSSNLNLSNSIVAQNTAVAYGSPLSAMDCYSRDYYGPVDDINAGPDTISTTVCGGATVVDPMLGPLANNGGLTQTHALLPGSPAINNGTAAGATLVDQRGIVSEGIRDSGAYEFIAAQNVVTIDKFINNEARESEGDSAQLLAGSLYRQVYEVTNNSADRLYQVRVFEDGNQVCNMYTLDPGETKQSCNTVETVLEGDQHVEVTVNAKVSGTSDSVSATMDSYYSGIINGQAQMDVTHYIDNRNADTAEQAQALFSSQTNVLFKVENTGDIELYRVKTYHDPVSPVNSGWSQQCVIGPLKPGQVRYCKRDISFTKTGLNHAMGRAQGVNAISSPTGVINAANPTYFIVP